MGRSGIFIFLFIMLLSFTEVSAQQTVQFSQYVFNGLAVNPAYAGYKEDWTLNLSSRLQWTGFAGAPKTATTSIDGVTDGDNKNVGVGLIFTEDNLGPENTLSVYLNYAYRLRLDDDDTRRLSFGLAFGGAQYRLNGSELSAIDIGDSSVPVGTESRFTPDFRFGAYYYSPNIYVGASVFNLLANTLKDITTSTPLISQQQTVYLTAGGLIPLSEFVGFKPSVLIKEDFKGPTNIDLTGCLAFNNSIWLGGSYRTGVAIWNKNNLQSSLENADAVSAIAEFYINDHFRIGYSFDFTISKLANYQNGSHELSLSISFPRKKVRIASPRYF